MTNDSPNIDAAIAGGIAAAALVAEQRWLPRQLSEQDKGVIAVSTLLACFGAWSARHDRKGTGMVAICIIAGLAGLGARASTVVDDLKVAAKVQQMVKQFRAGADDDDS